ncbi:hypothetical protein HDU97_004840 [Phlyctochytrium planicorne]|nr:hypothetical protein HDU97_004840 [Phlyctochytrium planicorne]
MNQGASFERNFNEIQKLLERAKNLDTASVDMNAIINTTAETEKKKKAPPKATPQSSSAPPPQPTQIAAAASSSSPSQKQNLFEISMLDGKSQAGRKPLRVIAAELDKRIEQLRSNQSEWESFQARIMEYQKAHTVSTDIIRQNRQLLVQYTPDKRQSTLTHAKLDHQLHRIKVLDKKKEIETETLRRKLEVVKKKESLMENGRRKEKEEMNRFQVTQKKWFILVATMARIGYIERALTEFHFRKQEQFERNLAARTIQKCWRRYKERLLEEKKRQAFGKIAKVFTKYVHRRRLAIKNRCADKVRQFFKEVHDVAKLLKIVKKYRFSVVKAQQMCKSFLEIRKAQVTLLCKYWDKHENGWWSQRKHNSDKFQSNASLDEKTPKAAKAKKKGKKQQKEEDKDKGGDKNYIKIAEYVAIENPPNLLYSQTKIRIMLEDLIVRKRVYRNILAEYRVEYAKWSTEYKKTQQLRGLRPGMRVKTPADGEKQPPKKPIFKVLPPVQDMYLLIEKGVAQTLFFFLSQESEINPSHQVIDIPKSPSIKMAVLPADRHRMTSRIMFSHDHTLCTLQTASILKSNNLSLSPNSSFPIMPGKEDKKAAAIPAAVTDAVANNAALSKPKTPRPDKAAHEKEVDEIKGKIDELQKKLGTLQQTINGTDNIKDTYDGKRKEFKTKLDELTKARTEVNEQRTKILDKIKAIQGGIKKKNDDVKSSKDKLGVKTVEEADRQIASLEQQLTAGNLKLMDEKKIVAEISKLKTARKQLDTLGTQASTVESDKKQLDTLRAELDTLSPKKEAINKEFDVVKAQLKELDDSKRKDMGSFTDLIGQKKSIKAEVDALYTQMRSLKTEFQQQNKDWFAWEQAERDRRRREFVESKKKDETIRLTRAAEEELENAKIPAFTEEINICNSLIAFLQPYSSKPKAAASAAVSAESKHAVRSVDTSIPEGLVVLKKEEEDYMVMGKGKSKTKSKQRGGSAKEPVEPSKTAAIKLDITTMDLFAKLKVNFPTTVADADGTIEQLEAKKTKFLENQKEETAKNKAKAEAKIAALKAKVDAGGSADDAIKELEGAEA